MWSRPAPGCCHRCHRCHRQRGGGRAQRGAQEPQEASAPPPSSPCPTAAAGCPPGPPVTGAGAPAGASGSRPPRPCPCVPLAHVPTCVCPHLLQQRQLAEELVCAVLGQEVGPLGAGLGVGPADVLEEAGLGQGRGDGVLVLLVQGQRQPVAPRQPPGEALQGRPVSWQAWGHPACSRPGAPADGLHCSPRTNASCLLPAALWPSVISGGPPRTEPRKSGTVPGGHGQAPSPLPGRFLTISSPRVRTVWSSGCGQAPLLSLPR